MNNFNYIEREEFIDSDLDEENSDQDEEYDSEEEYEADDYDQDVDNLKNDIRDLHRTFDPDSTLKKFKNIEIEDFDSELDLDDYHNSDDYYDDGYIHSDSDHEPEVTDPKSKLPVKTLQNKLNQCNIDFNKLNLDSLMLRQTGENDTMFENRIRLTQKIKDLPEIKTTDLVAIKFGHIIINMIHRGVSYGPELDLIANNLIDRCSM